MKSEKMQPKAYVEPRRHAFLIDVLLRLIREKPLGMIGGVIVLIMLVVGIFAEWLAPYAMNEAHLIDRLSPPSARYILGTDQLGRDILSNLIYGARISMIVGVCAAAINVVTAALIGCTTGFIGGKLDLLVQRFVDAWMSFPTLLLILTLMSIVGRGLPQIIAVLGIAGGIRESRLARSVVIRIREETYVEAARVIGCSTSRVLFRHILPNVMAPLIIIFTLNVGAAILTESTISFLGFGVPPGVPSWGSMLSLEGRQYMEIAPQLALWPGLTLSIAVYSINMLGDAVRDLLDPRLRGGLGRYGRVKRERPKQ